MRMTTLLLEFGRRILRQNEYTDVMTNTRLHRTRVESEHYVLRSYQYAIVIQVELALTAVYAWVLCPIVAVAWFTSWLFNGRFTEGILCSLFFTCVFGAALHHSRIVRTQSKARRLINRQEFDQSHWKADPGDWMRSNDWDFLIQAAVFAIFMGLLVLGNFFSIG